MSCGWVILLNVCVCLVISRLSRCIIWLSIMCGLRMVIWLRWDDVLVCVVFV